MALLVIGGLVGWATASLGDGSTAASTTTVAAPVEVSKTNEIVPRDPRPPPTVIWTRATTVPTPPRGFEYAGTSNLVELDGSIFTIVNFRDGVGSETTSQL